MMEIEYDVIDSALFNVGNDLAVAANVGYNIVDVELCNYSTLLLMHYMRDVDVDLTEEQKENVLNVSNKLLNYYGKK